LLLRSLLVLLVLVLVLVKEMLLVKLLKVLLVNQKLKGKSVVLFYYL
jgi:hypothetical protein